MTRLRILAGLTIATLLVAIGAWTAIRPAAAGGGGCYEPVTDGHGTSVDLKGNCIITTILRIQTGDTVAFTNRDEVDHTVTGAGIRSGVGSPFGSFEPMAPGATYLHKFEMNGVYVYYCAFHPGMVGAIVVGDGSGPASANGDGVSPLGVTLRDRSSGARAGDAVSAGTHAGGAGAGWMVALGIGVVIAIATMVTALRRRRWHGVHRVES